MRSLHIIKPAHVLAAAKRLFSVSGYTYTPLFMDLHKIQHLSSDDAIFSYIVISRLHKLLVTYMCIPTCTFYNVLYSNQLVVHQCK